MSTESTNPAVGTEASPVAAAAPPPETPAPEASKAKAEPVVVKNLSELDWKSVLPRFTWLKFLGAGFLTSLITAIATFMFILAGYAVMKKDPLTIIVFGLAFAAIVGVISAFAFILLPELTKVWKFRIKGTSLICAYNKESKDLTYYFLPRGQRPKDHDIALVIPVRGWFSDPHIVLRNDEWMHLRATGRWTIIYPLSRYFNGGIDELSIRLKDWDGNTARLRPMAVMSIISRFSGLREDGFPKARLDFVITSLLGGEAEAEQRRQEDMAAVLRLLYNRSADLDLVLEAVKRLDASKRFIKSEEAKAIREWLVRELYQRLAPDDLRRQNYIFDELKRAGGVGSLA